MSAETKQEQIPNKFCDGLDTFIVLSLIAPVVSSLGFQIEGKVRWTTPNWSGSFC
jgi:hypothetical protein